MSKLMVGVVLFLSSIVTNAASCDGDDITRSKWHFYTDNPDALYCQVSVSGNNKTSGFCRGNTEFDKGTKLKINGGKLTLSDSCDVSGAIKLDLNQSPLAEAYGSGQVAIKIVKAKMSAAGESILGLMSVERAVLTRYTFTAARN